MDSEPNNKLFIPNTEGQLSLLLTKGGPRTGAGRKRIGITKKVSLTLTKDVWEQIEHVIASNQTTKSDFIRKLIEQHFTSAHDER
jgi:hypothetical protein